MDEFERSLVKVLIHEGGYVNHPDDPGGATNRGVIQRTYDTYRKSKGLATQSVKLMTDAEMRAIYRREYWDRIQGDRLRPGVSYVVFDGAVNSGVSQSIKWLQRALFEMGLYSGKIDGIIGQETHLALEGVASDDELIARIIQRRGAFLRQLKTFKTFGRGWMARIAGVKAVGQAWASGGDAQIAYIAGADAKAMISDAKGLPPVGAGDAVAGGGGATTGVGAVLKTAQEQLEPYTGTAQFITKIVVFLVVAGIAVGAAGYAFRWYAKKKRDERADALDLQAVAG